MLRIAPRTWTAALLLGAAGLGGCARMPDLTREPPIDTTSPTAQAIAAAIASPGAYPSFADIPPAPVRPVQASRPMTVLPSLGQSTLVQAGPAEDVSAASEAFAARQRAGVAGVGAPTDADQAETEAFAAQQRARAITPSGR